MGGLWGASGIPFAAVGFKIKAETPKSCHGKWQSLEQRSGSEALGIKARVEERENYQLPSSYFGYELYPNSPSTIIPIAENVPMDVDSNSEAEQAALELTQAQEWVRTANEAQEKHQVEWKRQEEERKAKIVAAIKLAAELAVDREWRILLQVSLGFHRFKLEVGLQFSRTWRYWL